MIEIFIFDLSIQGITEFLPASSSSPVLIMSSQGNFEKPRFSY